MIAKIKQFPDRYLIQYNELSKNYTFVIKDEPNNLLYNNEEKIRRKCIEEVKKKGIEQIKRRHKIYKNIERWCNYDSKII